MIRKTLAAAILVALILSYPGVVSARGRFECYIFGVNIRTFENSNWLKVAAGAAASILTHELGHVIYLQLADKEWELKGSSSGLAIVTPDYLSDDESRSFGMAGFALQTAVGTLLTSFDKTRSSDYTKGWVGVNTVQLFSYTSRPHVDGDDFQMIEQAGGDPEQIHNVFTMISAYNFRRLESGFPRYPASKVGTARDPRLHNNYYLDTLDADPEARMHVLESRSFLANDQKQDLVMQYRETYPGGEHTSAPGSLLATTVNVAEISSRDLDPSPIIGNLFGVESKNAKKLNSGFD
jgi:hypothetical protein